MASFVPIGEAQQHLIDLLDRAERGEEIVINRDGRTSMKLVPFLPVEQGGKRIFGQNLLGITYTAPDFDDPMCEEDLKEWGM